MGWYIEYDAYDIVKDCYYEQEHLQCNAMGRNVSLLGNAMRCNDPCIEPTIHCNAWVIACNDPCIAMNGWFNAWVIAPHCITKQWHIATHCITLQVFLFVITIFYDVICIIFNIPSQSYSAILNIVMYFFFLLLLRSGIPDRYANINRVSRA